VENNFHDAPIFYLPISIPFQLSEGGRESLKKEIAEFNDAEINII
jgi:hypothetical protein